MKPSDEAVEAAVKIENINPKGTQLNVIKKKKPKNITEEEKILLEKKLKKDLTFFL